MNSALLKTSTRGSCAWQSWKFLSLFQPKRAAIAVRYNSLQPKQSGVPNQIKHAWRHRIAQLDALFLSGVSRFHEITGYAEIEKMKTQLTELEEQVSLTRKQVRKARQQYNEHLANRTNSQSEMNELLMRKQSWLPSDLERFTQLYKDDHRIQLGVTKAKEAYNIVESQLEELQQQAGKLIGARYQEEQLWSDKIRQASTWGTWILMGINVLLFFVVQLVLEPWKRKRLVHSFEAKVQDIIQSQPQPEVLERIVAEPIPTTKQNEPKLTWSTLVRRLKTGDYAPQPVILLRPVEAGALALASGALFTFFTAALLRG